jgi:hypothetical protein
VYHNGRYFKVWDNYGLPLCTFKTASFSEDPRGRWNFNVVVETKPNSPLGQNKVDINLWLKGTSTCSDGAKQEVGLFFHGIWSQSSRSRSALAIKSAKK